MNNNHLFPQSIIYSIAPPSDNAALNIFVCVINQLVKYP